MYPIRQGNYYYSDSELRVIYALRDSLSINDKNCFIIFEGELDLFPDENFDNPELKNLELHSIQFRNIIFYSNREPSSVDDLNNYTPIDTLEEEPVLKNRGRIEYIS